MIYLLYKLDEDDHQIRVNRGYFLGSSCCFYFFFFCNSRVHLEYVRSNCYYCFTLPENTLGGVNTALIAFQETDIHRPPPIVRKSPGVLAFTINQCMHCTLTALDRNEIEMNCQVHTITAQYI